MANTKTTPALFPSKSLPLPVNPTYAWGYTAARLVAMRESLDTVMAMVDNGQITAAEGFDRVRSLRVTLEGVEDEAAAREY